MKGQRLILRCLPNAAYVLGLVCCCTSVLGASAFPLLDGPRRAVIVAQGRTLQRGIEQCTGIKLDIVSERAYKRAPDRFPIYVGDTTRARERLAGEIATLDAEGYIFLVREDEAIIYAPRATTDTGDPLTWAQANFLRKFVGMEWLIPGDLGIHAPQQDKVLIPVGKWVETPAFLHRHWSGYAGSAGPSWRVRASGGGGRFHFHHNLFRIINRKTCGEHPEYFPVIRTHVDQKLSPIYRDLAVGERYIPPDGAAAYYQPCTSNPGVVERVVAAADDHFQKHPTSKYFSLAVNDSGGFCHCDLCLAVTPHGVEPDSDAADGYRFYKFYNEVAERVVVKHPDARLGFLVYSNLTDWHPEKLHPALMPYLTMSMADRWDPAFAKKQNARIEKWSRSATHFGIYEWLFGQGYIIPRIYLREFAEGIRAAHAGGAEGFYAEAYPHWGLDGPKLWVIEQLLWNPDQDVEALLDRWHEAMFAEAAAPMRDYFDHLENAWRTQQPTDSRRGGYRLYASHNKARQLTEVFPPQVCEEAWQLLDRAGTSATQSIVKQRIAFYRNAFNVTRIASNRYASAQVLESLAKTNRKVPVTLEQWLQPLDTWVAYGSVNDYAQSLYPSAPYSLQELISAKLRNVSPPSLAVWDTQPNVIMHVAHRAVSDALQADPKNRDALIASCDALLTSDGAAATLMRKMVRRSVMTSRESSSPPDVDGHIEKAWGEPAFDGHFIRYPLQIEEAETRIRLWMRHDAQRVYVAVYVEQDPSTIKRGDPLGHDNVVLSDTGYVKPGDGTRDFGYLQRDAIGVTMPGQLYPITIVTADGDLYDGNSSSHGYRPDWDGVTARTHTDERGWSAEFAIEPFESLGDIEAKPVVNGFNFFHITNGKRSAWVPAAPRLWSVHPRSSGYVCFEQTHEQ